MFGFCRQDGLLQEIIHIGKIRELNWSEEQMYIMRQRTIYNLLLLLPLTQCSSYLVRLCRMQYRPFEEFWSIELYRFQSQFHVVIIFNWLSNVVHYSSIPRTSTAKKQIDMQMGTPYNSNTNNNNGAVVQEQEREHYIQFKRTLASMKQVNLESQIISVQHPGLSYSSYV